MKKLLFSGLLVIIPVGLTFYVLYLLYQTLTSISKWIPLPHFPGSGIIYIFLLVFVIGLVSQWWVTKKGIDLLEVIIAKFPGVKTLYHMTKETVSSFAGEKRAFSKVVLYKEQEDVMRIGFVTTEDVRLFELGDEFIAVYFPHGLQISGELRLLPRNRVVFVGTPVEDALQFCLSAGVASKK